MTQQNNWQQTKGRQPSGTEQVSAHVFLIDGIKITVRRAEAKAAQAQEAQLKSVLIKVKARQESK